MGRIALDLLLSVLAYLAALGSVGVVTFGVVIVVAGLLPSFFETFVLAEGWVAVIVLPVLFARRIWRRRRPAVVK